MTDYSWDPEYDSTWEGDEDYEDLEKNKQPRQHNPWTQTWNRAAADLQRYRHGYPDLDQTPPNLRFYRNEIPFRPNGVLIETLHNVWKRDYDRLEMNHSYIQWLFPLREPGVNHHATPLTPVELQLMVADEEVCRRFLKSYKLMLGFYGIQLVDEASGKVARAANWESRFNNLDTRTHNNLRITRILKCLGEMGYEHYQSPLVRFFLEETLCHGNLQYVKESVLNYFMFTVKDKNERKQLVLFAWEHYEPKQRFIWGPVEVLQKLKPPVMTASFGECLKEPWEEEHDIKEPQKKDHNMKEQWEEDYDHDMKEPKKKEPWEEDHDLKEPGKKDHDLKESLKKYHDHDSKLSGRKDNGMKDTGREDHDNDSKYLGREVHDNDSKHPGREDHDNDSKHPGSEDHDNDSKHPGREDHDNDSNHPGREDHDNDSNHPGREDLDNDMQHPSREDHDDDLKQLGREDLKESKTDGNEDKNENDTKEVEDIKNKNFGNICEQKENEDDSTKTPNSEGVKRLKKNNPGAEDSHQRELASPSCITTKVPGQQQIEDMTEPAGEHNENQCENDKQEHVREPSEDHHEEITNKLGKEDNKAHHEDKMNILGEEISAKDLKDDDDSENKDTGSICEQKNSEDEVGYMYIQKKNNARAEESERSPLTEKVSQTENKSQSPIGSECEGSLVSHEHSLKKTGTNVTEVAPEGINQVIDNSQEEREKTKETLQLGTVEVVEGDEEPEKCCKDKDVCGALVENLAQNMDDIKAESKSSLTPSNSDKGNMGKAERTDVGARGRGEAKEKEVGGTAKSSRKKKKMNKNYH